MLSLRQDSQAKWQFHQAKRRGVNAAGVLPNAVKIVSSSEE